MLQQQLNRVSVGSGLFPDPISLKNLEGMIILKTNIDLDNNYYLKIANIEEKLPSEVTNMEKINLVNIVKKKNLLMKIDFNNLDEKEYKKVLRRLLLVRKIVVKNKVKVGVLEDSKTLLGFILNYDEDNKKQNEFIQAINAIFYNTRYERYNYIYDTVCDYLDSFFYGKNLCDFKDNKCGEKRNTSSLTGCCHHFKHKALGPSSKLVLCEYLKEDYTCGVKCISCKLFTCDYLEKKGIKFRIKDILLLDTFFNPLQKYFIKYMVFTPKGKILKRLMII